MKWDFVLKVKIAALMESHYIRVNLLLMVVFHRTFFQYHL